jgi:hypothetical protein
MAATTYTEQQGYNKFNVKSHSHSDSHSHEDGCGCQGSTDEDCGCCPTGLVAIYDDKGQHIGCVTPNDAELYKKNTYVCQDGYVKLIRNFDGDFLGCVSEENFHDIYVVVNGSNS